MTKDIKTFEAEEAKNIREEICNSNLDLEAFFETKQKDNINAPPLNFVSFRDLTRIMDI